MCENARCTEWNWWHQMTAGGLLWPLVHTRSTKWTQCHCRQKMGKNVLLMSTSTPLKQWTEFCGIGFSEEGCRAIHRIRTDGIPFRRRKIRQDRDRRRSLHGVGIHRGEECSLHCRDIHISSRDYRSAWLRAKAAPCWDKWAEQSVCNCVVVLSQTPRYLAYHW
jgi:hypothetical protein